METIKLNEYNTSLGKLIVLDDLNVLSGLKIKPSTLLDNPSKYLDKDKTYYFICKNGTTSRRVVKILSVYGFKAIRVTL